MITDRQQKLLEKIIAEYVNTAEPVSSKSLEKSGFLDVSSATIRSEMNELEKAGYLEQPHTSAGRVPTDLAYRFYVDKVVKAENKGVALSEKRRIDKTIEESPRNPHVISRSVAQLLSELSDNLVIANVRDFDDFFKVGLKSLFEMPEFQEFDRIFRVTSFFEDFEQAVAQMMAPTSEGEVQVYIGRESPFPGVQDEAILFTEYRLPDRCTGTITLIGPTRMNYERNIALIKYVTNKANELSDF